VAARAARAYVAGPRAADAIRACRRLGGEAIAGTVGFWDDGETPREIVGACLAALDALEGARLDCDLSVKAAPLGFAPALLSELLDRGGRAGVRVKLDALGPGTVEPTFRLLAALTPAHPGLGCTLPARWRRSVEDAERAVALGLRVRVVKGQFPDAREREQDPRTGFLEVVERVKGRGGHVAVATHDAELAREALARLRASGTSCELELLLGLPRRRPVGVARAAGVGVRLYVPYGHAWLPYRLSEAGQHPGVLWWAVRDLVRGRGIRPPVEEGRHVRTG
jgi:proline dehydrogenase